MDNRFITFGEFQYRAGNTTVNSDSFDGFARNIDRFTINDQGIFGHIRYGGEG
jgi:hypothetical protein